MTSLIRLAPNLLKSVVSSDLTKDYLATRFASKASGLNFILGAGAPLNGLPPGKDSFAILTAYNPQSKKSSMADNQAANAELGRRLEALGFEAIAIDGADPSGKWMEPSFLVYGLELDKAIELGREWGKTPLFGERRQTLFQAWFFFGKRPAA